MELVIPASGKGSDTHTTRDGPGQDCRQYMSFYNANILVTKKFTTFSFLAYCRFSVNAGPWIPCRSIWAYVSPLQQDLTDICICLKKFGTLPCHWKHTGSLTIFYTSIPQHHEHRANI
jgi:hypothetical protein